MKSDDGKSSGCDRLILAAAGPAIDDDLLYPLHSPVRKAVCIDQAKVVVANRPKIMRKSKRVTLIDEGGGPRCQDTETDIAKVECSPF